MRAKGTRHRGLSSGEKRRKIVGRVESGSFFALPHKLMDDERFLGLNRPALKLLLDLGRQFNGRNNGDLTAAWTIMKPRGWVSRSTLEAALKELQDRGLIEKTRQGGRNQCNLFALAWKPVDECGGKLDPFVNRGASLRFRSPGDQTEN